MHRLPCTAVCNGFGCQRHLGDEKVDMSQSALLSILIFKMTVRPVHHVSASSVKQAGGQTDGMSRANAITEVSDQLCSSSTSSRLSHENMVF